MAGMPQMPPQMPPGGGGMPPGGPQAALGALGKKPSTPDSGAPLLQMIMTLLAGAGMKDFTGSITSLMKTLKGGDQTHHKASGAPPGMQPSRPGMPPAGPQAGGAPPSVAGQPPMPQGGPQGPGAGGMGAMNPQMLLKLIQMLMGGQGAQGGPPPA